MRRWERGGQEAVRGVLIVEGDLVQNERGLAGLARHFSEIYSVGIDAAPFVQQIGGADASMDGIFKVAFGIDVLGFGGGEEFHQAACVFFVWGESGHDHGGEVFVGSAFGELGEDDSHGLCGAMARIVFWLGEHMSEIVIVRDCQIALSCGDGSYLGAVVSCRAAGEVFFQFDEEVAGFFFAVMDEHGGEEGEVVGIVSVSDADSSAPFFGGEFFVGEAACFLGRDAVFGCHDDSEASCQGEPFVVGVSVSAGDISADFLGLEFGGDAVGGLDCLSDIGGEEDIGGACASFQGDSFYESFFGVEDVDVDSRFFLEAVEEGFYEEGLSEGVDIDGIDGVVWCVGVVLGGGVVGVMDGGDGDGEGDGEGEVFHGGFSCCGFLDANDTHVRLSVNERESPQDRGAPVEGGLGGRRAAAGIFFIDRHVFLPQGN